MIALPAAPLGIGRGGWPLLTGGFAVLLALGVAIFWLVGETQLQSDRTAESLARRLAFREALSNVQDAETGQRGYLLTGDPVYLEPYTAARAALPGLSASLHSAPDAEALARFDTALALKLAELERTIALTRDGRSDAALAIVKSGEGRSEMQEIRAALATLDRAEAAALDRAEAALQRSGLWLRLGAVAAIGAVLLLAVVGIGLGRRHAASLAAANRAVRAANDSLEQRVAERTAALAEANEEVQRFATVVTHDLRAPLVNIMGFTGELESSLPPLRELADAAGRTDPGLVTAAARAALDTDIPEALGFIQGASARMDRLINAILRLSRDGRRVLRPEAIAMAPLLEGLAASLAHQSDGMITIDPSLPDLESSDRLALEQIFGNLLDNAVKYLDPARPGRIVVRGRDRGRFLVYEVEDNGRGIDARDLTRIFEPFRRAGPQTMPGEGIGLAHVRALARRLGGVVTCDSTPGQGSVFRVTLPPRLPPSETTGTRQPASPSLEKVA